MAASDYWRHMPLGPRATAATPVRQTSTRPSGSMIAMNCSIFVSNGSFFAGLGEGGEGCVRFGAEFTSVPEDAGADIELYVQLQVFTGANR